MRTFTLVLLLLAVLVYVAWAVMAWRGRQMLRARKVTDLPKPERKSVSAEPERIRRTSCMVTGCQVKGPHSHAEDLIRRLGGQ